eukprot:gene18136-24576_t
MVESSTAKAAEMALKLETVHRCRGLEDLFGLFAFLKCTPWSNHFWWSRVLQRPVEAGCQLAHQQLLRLLRPTDGGLMWRTAKRDVMGQLGIPPQHASLTLLQLSAVERHFYSRQHKHASLTLLPHISWSAGIVTVAKHGGVPGRDRCRQQDKSLANRDVMDQLGIPPQHASLTLLQLSAVERHFYSCQHKEVPGLKIQRFSLKGKQENT